MTEQELALEKAKAKSLAHHFHKVASHHEKKAELHEKAAEAHLAHHEHHKEMMGKAAEAGDEHMKEHHKEAAAFHKFKHGHHEKMHKLHKSMHEHYKAMAEAHEAGEAAKVFKAAGIEEEPLSTRPVTQPPAADPAQPTPTSTAPVAKAAGSETQPAAPSTDTINETIQKALDVKLSEAVNAAFERVLCSEDFSKKVDQSIATKLLEKLGSASANEKIQTFPVPRAGQPGHQSAAAKAAPAEMPVDEELAELVKFE